MKIKVIKAEDISERDYMFVSQLLYDAFEERREQGINFKCGTFSPQDVKNEFANKSGYLFLALDESNKIVGTVSLIERFKGSFKYASHDNLAISSVNKGKGIASRLFREVLLVANLARYDFLTSFTATTADSSVLFHKKNGFVIYEKSYGSSYDSYSFIYPLKKMRFMRFIVFNKIIYVILTLRNKIKTIFK